MALQMDHESLRLAVDILIQKFQLLNDWFTDIRPLVGYELDARGPMSVGRTGRICIDGKPAGNILWNGMASLDLKAKAKYSLASAIHKQLLADIPDAVALMSLDVAETRLAGHKQTLMHAAMSGRIDDLAKRLGASGFANPIEITSGCWWI
jgi:hypothetical protein